MSGARVLLTGAGDLGMRIAAALTAAPEIDDVVVAGRAHGAADLRVHELDLRRRGDIERLLRTVRPDLIVQCASALSPWWLSEHPTPLHTAIERAGFALQLPLQLPLLLNVMLAVHETATAARVVNASYPDVTHAVLAARGLAPSIGIGNVSMIEARVRTVVRDEPLVRVIAHHAQVTPAIRAMPPDASATRARVYLGDDGRRADAMAFAAPPLPAERSLNALPAATAIPLLRALAGGPPIRTSAPAPAGLPGGWPVRVGAARIDLDLPPGVQREEVVAFLWDSARQDGIERVDDDGTVTFTAAARDALPPHARALADPLPIDHIDERRDLLLSLLGIECRRTA